MQNKDLTVRETYENVRTSLGPELCAILDQPGWSDVMVTSSSYDAGIVVVDTDIMRPVPCRVNENGVASAARVLAAYSSLGFNDNGDQSLDAVIPLMNLRCSFVSPPATEKTIVTFRKPNQRLMTLDELLGMETLSGGQADFLIEAMAHHKNIIFSGKTGSGKTSIMNTMLNLIDPMERLYIIEDIKEIISDSHTHLFNERIVINRNYSYANAIETALRQRPDRIIIGECRYGDQALAMLQAWGTGHPGGISTIHANDAKNVLERLDQLCSQVSVSSQKPMITDTIDIVVQMGRLGNSTKRQITELYDVREDRYIR